MAPAAASPLLKLFGTDPTGPGGSLQHIRDKIYSHVWSRVRRDHHKLDFVISQYGVNLNTPVRHWQECGEPCPVSKLYLVNKQISKDFCRYIYTVNDLQVDISLQEMQTSQKRAVLDKYATLLRNPNFQKYTRRARLRIHFPPKYPVANLPDMNQLALDNISYALEEFQSLGHMSIQVSTVQGLPLDYELRLAAFSFYPMRSESCPSSFAVHMLVCRIAPRAQLNVPGRKR